MVNTGNKTPCYLAVAAGYEAMCHVYPWIDTMLCVLADRAGATSPARTGAPVSNGHGSGRHGILEPAVLACLVQTVPLLYPPPRFCRAPSTLAADALERMRIDGCLLIVDCAWSKAKKLCKRTVMWMKGGKKTMNKENGKPWKDSRPDKTGVFKKEFERNRRIIYASQNVCALCGLHVDFSLRFPDPMSPSVDHIIPVAKGGHPSALYNLQLVHLCCNRAKGNRILIPKEKPKPLKPKNYVSNDWANF